MKKLIVSVAMMFALSASFGVMAQDAKTDKTKEKAKTECSKDKKDKKEGCCKDKKDGKACDKKECDKKGCDKKEGKKKAS